MKFRTRLGLTFTAILVIALLGFTYLVADEIKPRYSEAQEEVLVDFAEFMATHVSENALYRPPLGDWQISTRDLEKTFQALRQRPLGAQIYALKKNEVDTRIYVVDRSGRVIFDSDNGRDLGQDYSRWRDVARALRGQYGARTTDNDPLYSGATMYVARPIVHQGQTLGALAIGKPMRSRDAFMWALGDKLWVAGLVFAAIFAVLGYLLYRSLTTPLARIQRYALDLSQGANDKRPPLGSDEVADVQRALETMRQALDGKTYIESYIQSLTHQLKAPVAGIQGAAELLSEPMPPEQQQRFLMNIREQSTRLRDLIDRLLDLARLENTQALSRLERVPVHQLFAETVASLDGLAAQFGIKVQAHHSDAHVVGDQFLLTQALINLSKNAIEHAHPGSTVHLACTPGRQQLALVVINHGEKIPSFAFEHIFDRFYSLPNTRGKKGSGIGLSFTVEIAKLHGGHVRIENMADGRIKATLELPVR
jgi:two-component system sensor histidine kinase CreC